MIVTAWNNGNWSSTGAGYGLKIKIQDRDSCFNRNDVSVFIHIEGKINPIEVNIAKKSFWSDTCRELISADIGRWMIENGLAPWKKGYPPKLHLIPFHDNHFQLKK
jgi:hypothetical protein